MIVHSGEYRIVDISLADGTKLTATNRHPLWDATTHRFTYPIDLRGGDQLREATGTLLTIDSVRTHDENITAYNLTIHDLHTYYARQSPILVHNSCGPTPSDTPNFKDPSQPPGPASRPGGAPSSGGALAGGEDRARPEHERQRDGAGCRLEQGHESAGPRHDGAGRSFSAKPPGYRAYVSSPDRRP